MSTVLDSFPDLTWTTLALECVNRGLNMRWADAVRAIQTPKDSEPPGPTDLGEEG